MEIISKNVEQTQEIAKILGQTILESRMTKKDHASVLALEGDLGGGKTTFIQGLARGLGIRENLTSPTFVIMKSYQLKDNSFAVFYHLDCYRLKDENDLEALGIKEILSNPKNIVAIEWAERVTKILPKNLIKIRFKFMGENQRAIKIIAAQSPRTVTVDKEAWEEVVDFTKIKKDGVKVDDILCQKDQIIKH